MKPIWVLFLTGSALAQVQRNIDVTESVNLSNSDTSYWRTQTTGIAGGMLNAVSVVDGNVCWLAGASGRVIRTINGGNTWSLINPGIIGTQNIYAFEGVSDNIAFASTTASDTTYIYRTTNAGLSWEQVFSQSEGSIFGIKMYNSNNGIAAGDPVGGLWTILRTTNGGETWFRIPTAPPQVGGGNRGTRLGTFGTLRVWFFDNVVRQFSSNDGGNTWTYSPDSASYVPLIWWNRDHHSLDPAALYVTWERVFRYQVVWIVAGFTPNFPFQPTELVGAFGTSEYWLVQGAVYYTPDAASTWAVTPPHGLNKPVGLIDMVTLSSEVSAWATGTGDTVYHYHRVLTGVDEDPQPTPREFSLSQNYPNPFNPSTTIKFALPKSGHVTLKIYDLLGHEVATLVNEVKQAGGYEVKWAATGLPSGVYFYRLKTDEFIQTRKLLLLK